MGFQTTVSKTQALGNVGQISKSFHNFCNTVSGIVADANVVVGGFVQSKSSPTNENEVIGASGQAITGDILGVVVRDIQVNTGNSTATLALEKGDNCTILNEGSIFIATSAIAAKGQYVFLKDADGSLAFDSSSTKTNYTYTGFRVTKGNETATSGIIEISTARA